MRARIILLTINLSICAMQTATYFMSACAYRAVDIIIHKMIADGIWSIMLQKVFKIAQTSNSCIINRYLKCKFSHSTYRTHTKTHLRVLFNFVKLCAFSILLSAGQPRFSPTYLITVHKKRNDLFTKFIHSENTTSGKDEGCLRNTLINLIDKCYLPERVFDG